MTLFKFEMSSAVSYNYDIKSCHHYIHILTITCIHACTHGPPPTHTPTHTHTHTPLRSMTNNNLRWISKGENLLAPLKIKCQLRLKWTRYVNTAFPCIVLSPPSHTLYGFSELIWFRSKKEESCLRNVISLCSLHELSPLPSKTMRECMGEWCRKCQSSMKEEWSILISLCKLL